MPVVASSSRFSAFLEELYCPTPYVIPFEIIRVALKPVSLNAFCNSALMYGAVRDFAISAIVSAFERL